MSVSRLKYADMSEIAQEIASQPACWRRAHRLAPGLVAELPAQGARVAVVGCGTSWFVAQAYASMREAEDLGETDAFTASEFPGARRYDRVLAISRSGTTTEVVRLLEATDLATTAIVAASGTPVSEAADACVLLEFADERSVVQTRFATTTLALLRAHLGHDPVAASASDAERALERELPHDPRRFEHFVFLGHGWTVGLANEAALKMRESAQAHAEAYPAMEYRHGPISLAGPGSLVWILDSPDPTVADAVASTGATVHAATLDPAAELILIQRTAVALAVARGLDPDNPRNLTRSVVLS
jgi:fructoselysine-6-P-deglycase FrlB-like protein